MDNKELQISGNYLVKSVILRGNIEVLKEIWLFQKKKRINYSF